MREYLNLIRSVLPAKSHLVLNTMIKELLRRFYKNEFFYVLQYDLTNGIIVPQAKIPVTIRSIQKDDVHKIIDLKEKGIPGYEFYERIQRVLFVHSHIPECYVGITKEGMPCVMCWMVQPSENDKIQSFYQGNILDLKPNEVLLEGIYTHPAYRGLNLMGHMTIKLFEKASKIGAQTAVTYLRGDNHASIRGSKRIGWQPFMIKKVAWRLFKRKITYSSEIVDDVFSMD